MSAQDLSKDVLEQLECPVYMQYMLPHITLCGNGHNICSSCKQKIQKCPTCREPLSDTRNRALEKLAVRVECPCANKPHGCTLTFPIALLCEHEDICQFSPFNCPLNYCIKCNWTGHLTELKGHVLYKDKDLLRRPSVRRLGLTKPAVGKFNKDKIYVNILLSNDNLFFEAYEVLGDGFYYVIQYIGPENGGSKFQYKFVLQSGAEEITVCRVASSYSTDVKEVYDTGKCVKLFCDNVYKNPTKCNSLQIFIYCKVTLHVSGVTAPIIRSAKNCNRSLRYRS